MKIKGTRKGMVPALAFTFPLFILWTFFYLGPMGGCAHEGEGGKTMDAKKWEEKISSSLPSPWKVEVRPLQDPPFQWQSEVAKGLKVTIFHPGQEETKKRPYAELHVKKDQVVTQRVQMVRYLYSELQAHYSFPPFVRAHPDELETVTEQFVIIRPGPASEKADGQIPMPVLKAWKEVMSIPEGGSPHVVTLEWDKELEEDKAKLRKRFPQKKAVVWRSTDPHQKISLKVMTLSP